MVKIFYFFYNTCPVNQTEKNVISSAAGGVVLIVVVIFIWLRVRRRQRNDEYPPLLGDNRDGVVDVQNEFPSEGSDLTSERGFASFRSSTQSATDSSNIIVPNKKDNLNSKIKAYLSDLRWASHRALVAISQSEEGALTTPYLPPCRGIFSWTLEHNQPTPWILSF